ncbi:MAG: TlpA family protein disulfide reductase [Candidatus Brennerbacteria bacterium]|nr:TlpA family protein disulfide reductase [Candidatus Brennerbacteria bacterium]
MKTPLIIISVLGLVVVGWLLISNTGQRQNMNASNNTIAQIQTDSAAKFEKAPDFHLQDYNGETVNFSDFDGKPLVINSWAAWCPFCRKELVDFASTQKEFGDKAVIIAIDRAESLEVAKGYTDQQGTTNNLIFLLDPSDSFYQSIGGFSMPETIFVDKNGFIVDHKRGPMDINEIREKIKKLISLYYNI